MLDSKQGSYNFYLFVLLAASSTAAQPALSCQRSRYSVTPNVGVLRHNAPELVVRAELLDDSDAPFANETVGLTLTWQQPHGSDSDVVKLTALRSDPFTAINRFLVSVPASIRSNHGSYIMRLHVDGFWNTTTQRRSRCVLLLRRIVVQCGEGYTPVSGGCDLSEVPSVRRLLVVIGLAVFTISILALMLVQYRRGSNSSHNLSRFRCKQYKLYLQMWSSGASLEKVATAIDSAGDLALHTCAACGAPAALIDVLLRADPEAATKTDSSGDLPLHLLVQALSVRGPPADDELSVLHALITAYPLAVIEPDHSMRLAFELVPDEPIEAWHRLGMLLARPIDPVGRSDNWTRLLQLETNARTQMVDEILCTAYDTGQPFSVKELAYATDRAGRVALSVASKRNRRQIWQRLYFLGRFFPADLNQTI